MTLILPTFLSFSGYYFKGKNCWEQNFSLNLFSRNILRRFYLKTENLTPKKILVVKIPAKKAMVTMKIQNKYLELSFPQLQCSASQKTPKFLSTE